MTAVLLQPITERQREIFDYIADYYERERIGLTVREICGRFEFSSPNGAICHLKVLAAKGWISRRRYAARSIVPTVEALEHAV